MGQIRGIQKSGHGRILVDMCDCLEKKFPAAKQQILQEQPEKVVGKAGPGQNGASWECSTCTFINAEENQSCGMGCQSQEYSSRQSYGLEAFSRRNPYVQNKMAVWEGNGRVVTGYLDEEEEEEETIEIID